jgi:predicted RNA polymerase sigma factor
MRRDQRKRKKLEELGYTTRLQQEKEEDLTPIPDDMLRLIFTCCHPALNEEARLRAVALATNDPERRFLESRLQEVRNAYLD